MRSVCAGTDGGNVCEEEVEVEVMVDVAVIIVGDRISAGCQRSE